MQTISKIVILGLSCCISGWIYAQPVNLCVQNSTSCSKVNIGVTIDGETWSANVPANSYITTKANPNHTLRILREGQLAKQFSVSSNYFSVFITNPDQQCQDFVIFSGNDQNIYQLCTGG